MSFKNYVFLLEEQVALLKEENQKLQAKLEVAEIIAEASKQTVRMLLGHEEEE